MTIRIESDNDLLNLELGYAYNPEVTALIAELKAFRGERNVLDAAARELKTLRKFKNEIEMLLTATDDEIAND